MWKWLGKFAKPSVSLLMNCSIRKLYQRYKQIILGTECSRQSDGKVSGNMMKRQKALYLQWRTKRWKKKKNWRGNRISEDHEELWNEMKTQVWKIRLRNLHCILQMAYTLTVCMWMVSDRVAPSQESQQHHKQFWTRSGVFSTVLAQLSNSTDFCGDSADIYAGNIHLCWYQNNLLVVRLCDKRLITVNTKAHVGSWGDSSHMWLWIHSITSLRLLELAALNTENLQLTFIRPIINSTAATEKAHELLKVIVRLSAAKWKERALWQLMLIIRHHLRHHLIF